MSRRFALLAFAIALPLFAAEEPDWRDVVVRFTIGTEGELHVNDRLTVLVPAGVDKLERRYWSDAEQHVTLDRVLQVGPNGTTIELRGAREQYDGWVEWNPGKSTEPRTMTFIVETTVVDAVIPSWSISRGHQTFDENSQLTDPRQRLRALLPLWKKAKRDRYLLDYWYAMPPASTEGTTIQLQLYWPDGWKPVDELTGDNIGKPTERNAFDPDGWRVTHFFDVRGHAPVNVDVRRHALRMLAIVGFPFAALLFFAAFAVREMIVRTRPEPVAPDDAPEVLAARWTLNPKYPSIEAFLRRLEKQNELSIDIERRGDDDLPLVRLRLLVPREKLTPYERAGIDALMPDGWEVSSEEIQQREDFDPVAALYAHLKTVVAEARPKPPWYSRATTFAIFAAGIALLVLESVRYNRDPIVLGVALFSGALLVKAWPDDVSRILIRGPRWGFLVMLLPIVITTTIVAGVNFAGELPVGIYAASGLSIVMLAVVKAILAANGTRGPRIVAPPRTIEPADEGWGDALYS